MRKLVSIESWSPPSHWDGQPLFGDLNDWLRFRLDGTKVFGGGVVMLD
jgi:hypothetical protein